MDAYWLLKVHNDVDWTDEEALGGEVTREVTLCKDCECSYAPEHFMPGRLLCKLNNGVWMPEDFCSRGVDDGFCAWAKQMEDYGGRDEED